MANFTTKAPDPVTPINVSIENSDDIDVDIYLETPDVKIMVAYFSGDSGTLTILDLDDDDQEVLKAAGVAIENEQIKIK